MTEIELLVTTISHPAGFQVSLFGGMLQVYRLEDGRYAVDTENRHGIPQSQDIYEDATEAAQEFARRRHLRKLGYDHEKL